MRIKFLLLLFLIEGCVVACNNKTDTKQIKSDFYTSSGEWDKCRIPLIYPYEAVIVNKRDGWFMNLYGAYDAGFGNIKKINIVNGTILVYSGRGIISRNWGS